MHKNSVIRMIGRDARSIHGHSRERFPFRDLFDSAAATVQKLQLLTLLDLSSPIRRPRCGPVLTKALHVSVEVLGL